VAFKFRDTSFGFLVSGFEIQDASFGFQNWGILMSRLLKNSNTQELIINVNFILKPNLIALIAAASFFIIAIAKIFNRLLHRVRNNKKDIAESRFPAPKKNSHKNL
jgi:hypothetical protein